VCVKTPPHKNIKPPVPTPFFKNLRGILGIFWDKTFYKGINFERPPKKNFKKLWGFGEEGSPPGAPKNGVEFPHTTPYYKKNLFFFPRDKGLLYSPPFLGMGGSPPPLETPYFKFKGFFQPPGFPNFWVEGLF